MKFKCSPVDLSNALMTVSKAIASKTNIPILEGIKMSVKGETITLYATDMNISIEKKIKANIYMDGETIVQGKFLAEFIKKLEEEKEIEIEQYDNKMTIFYSNNETKIKCMDEETYPTIEETNNNNFFSIKEDELKDMLDKTITCVAIDETRPILKGCLFEVGQDKLTTVALDGYRLAICKANISNENEPQKIIIPGKSIMELIKILEDTGKTVKVYLYKNKVKFDLGHTIITSILLDGEFIKYDMFIPESFKTKVTVTKEEIKKSLDRAYMISKNKRSNYIKMKIENSNIEINTESETNEIKENVNCNIDGEEIITAFNSKYLQEALIKIREDIVKISFSGSTAPALITPVDGDSYMFIILPVRLQ